MRTPKRVVVDTNVFVSGLFWGGAPRNVLDCIASGVVTPCFTWITYYELHRILGSEKFRTERLELGFIAEDYLSQLAEVSLILREVSTPFLRVIEDDPADNEILACAVAAQACFIVTGDSHLLQLQRFAGISILTPQEFVKTLNT